jgi:Uma2 family endonuclease
MNVIAQQTPPLEAGDFMTRDEFMRRWEAHPEIKFAELIRGIVYMPSPLSLDHGGTDRDVAGWLAVYQAATPGTDGENQATTFLLEGAPQPDENLRILPEYGGSSYNEGEYLGGRPEFVAEICKSSVSYDLHQKLDLYEEAGIPEYLAVLVGEKEIRWHVLEGGKYQLLPPGEDGIWRSRIFPGLWLNGQALLAGNLAQVLATLQEGLRSPEHEAFVEKLAAAKRAH